MKPVKVQSLNKESFSRFGQVVEIPKEKPTISADILNYWSGLATFYVRGVTEVGICTVKKRAMSFKALERHLKTPEMLVPIDGEFVIPVAPAEKLEDPEALPPVDKISAFRVRKNQAIIMDPGVWHWAPFPKAARCSFLVIFKKDTSKDDLIIKDIPEIVLE